MTDDERRAQVAYWLDSDRSVISGVETQEFCREWLEQRDEIERLRDEIDRMRAWLKLFSSRT